MSSAKHPVLNSRWATKFPELYNDKCKVVGVTGTSVTLQSESVNGTATMSLITFHNYVETGMVAKLTEDCSACGGYGAVPTGGPPLDGQGPPERACPECTGRKVTHSNLGPCLVTEQCLQLQRTNPDTTSMYVFHDGDIKEVTKALVTEEDFQRASGDCVCDWCGKKYYDHPRYERERWRSQMADSDHPSYPLRQLCDGRLVKL